MGTLSEEQKIRLRNLTQRWASEKLREAAAHGRAVAEYLIYMQSKIIRTNG